MSEFNEFIDAVIEGARDIAGEAVKNFLKQTTQDSVAFKQNAEADLNRWVKELADGDIDNEDFASLVRGQWTEAALAALLKAGIAAQDAAKLQKKVLDIAVSAAIKILL